MKMAAALVLALCLVTILPTVGADHQAKPDLGPIEITCPPLDSELWITNPAETAIACAAGPG